MALNKPEVWLRGPLPNIPPLLQPVAHTLLQCREELNALMPGFPENLLWQNPARMASPGFHLQHMAGVLDRLLTYARGEALTETQLAYLGAEGRHINYDGIVETLVAAFNRQVDAALLQISHTDEGTLLEVRGVGRKLIPSTVLGLLVHAAEHVQRHYGQLLVTVNVLKYSL
jgi:hypothetical protein